LLAKHGIGDCKLSNANWTHATGQLSSYCRNLVVLLGPGVSWTWRRKALDNSKGGWILVANNHTSVSRKTRL
jgi:hypothetical protein